MKIKWYGHSCFEIQEDGFVIITDPFGKCVNYTLPATIPDIVSVSHYHEDHADSQYLKDKKIIDKDNLIFENNIVKIEGIRTWHDTSQGKDRGENIIFVFRFKNGLNVLHAGDLGEIPDEDFFDKAGKIDVVLVPVGGFYTIDGFQAYEFVKKLNAKIMIPMHFKTDMIDFELKKLDDFDFNYENRDILELESSKNISETIKIIRLEY